MIVIPAIDLRGGKVVRLSQGKFQEITIYSDRPLQIAKDWAEAGAQMLHIVDLDGAEKGKMENGEIIEKIMNEIDIPIEVGGGIRENDDIAKLIDMGVKRVILGTRVIENRLCLQEILNLWSDRIAVSIDCMRGKITTRGWTSISNIDAVDFVKELEQMGLKTLVYTDITRDGTLRGPNIEGIKQILQAVSVSVIASGGVSSLKDIMDLKKIEAEGLSGMIIGKALYERKVFLRDVIELCSQKG